MKKKILTIASICLILMLATLPMACGEVEPGPTPEPGPGPTPTPGPGPTPPTPPTEEPQYGGVLRVGAMESLVTLGYPATMFETMERIRATPAVEQLLRYDAEGKLVPWLATSWEEDPDTGAIILHLREEIKFHDGSDFNAEVVKWNLEQMMAAKKRQAQNLESVDVIDEYTVRLNAFKYDNTFLDELAFSALGMIISKEAYEIHGKDWCIANPVGTGPFKFVEWEKDVVVKYERFDDYWQEGKPYLDAMEYVQIEDPMTLMAAFIRGEIDCLLKPGTHYASELAATGRYNMFSIDAGLWNLIPDSIHFDLPFGDLRVRQAFAHSIDKQAICDALGYGLWQPANQMSTPGHWDYNPDVVGYPYNPEKARELMAEAGYPEGTRFKITLNFWSGEAILEQLMTAVQSQVSEVGFDAQLQKWIYAGYNIPFRGGWENGTCVHRGSNIATGNVLSRFFRNYIGDPLTYLPSGWRPPETRETLAQATATHDFEARKVLTQQLQKLMVDEYCLRIFLVLTPRFCVKYPEVHDDLIYAFGIDQWAPEDAWLSK